MRIKEFLMEKFKDANAIILFSSYARGDQKKMSDVDVLLISNNG